MPADVKIGKVNELASNNPAVAAVLRAIAATVQHEAASGVDRGNHVGGAALVSQSK